MRLKKERGFPRPRGTRDGKNRVLLLTAGPLSANPSLKVLTPRAPRKQLPTPLTLPSGIKFSACYLALGACF